MHLKATRVTSYGEPGGVSSAAGLGAKKALDRRGGGVVEASGVGVWRSGLAHLVWDQGAGGSNPLTPIFLGWMQPRKIEQVNK